MNYKAKEVYKNKTIAGNYDQKRFFSLKGRLVDKLEKQLVYKAVKFAQVLPGAKMLDIPCGTGRLSSFFGNLGFKVVGVDISANMIKQAQQKIFNQELSQKVYFQISNGEHLSFRNECFDVVVSLRFFGHLPPENRKNVLREFERVSTGFVIIAYYHKYSIQYFQRRKARLNNRIAWYPVDSKQIDAELNDVGLHRIARFYLLPGISETVIVIANKNRK